VVVLSVVNGKLSAAYGVQIAVWATPLQQTVDTLIKAVMPDFFLHQAADEDDI
jgi:hypothetical protein